MCGNAIKWAFAVGRKLQYQIGVRRTKEEQCDSGLYIVYDLNYNEEGSEKILSGWGQRRKASSMCILWLLTSPFLPFAIEHILWPDLGLD